MFADIARFTNVCIVIIIIIIIIIIMVNWSVVNTSYRVDAQMTANSIAD